MKHNPIYKNIICSILLQIVTIISGFVVPKVILVYFGSSVNGLVSSINQFLNYIQLLEGGLSGVIMVALYKPLADHDSKKVSAIIKATQNFFRKIGCIYIIYALVVAIAYPILVNTGFSAGYSFGLVLVLALNLFIQYFFSLSYKLLLNADRRVYYVSLTQIIIVLVNMISVVITARLFKDVLLLKLFSGLIFFIQPIMYGIYVNKNYKLDKNIEPDSDAIKQRWDGFGINLAYFIHTNTDVIILTLFSTLANVSVYSIYLMIVNALKSLVISVSQAITPSFGRSLASDDIQTVNSKFDEYEYGLSLVTIILFGCGIVLITPFVDVYTAGINDAQYHQVVFGIILCLAELVYCIREPYVSAAYSAGHFRQVSKYAYIEAGLNIVISLLLVKQFGIIGVAIGTLASMVYRLLCHIVYISRNILYRSIKKSLFNIFFTIANAICTCLISFNFFNLTCSTYVNWIILALKVMVSCCLIALISSAIFHRDDLKKVFVKVKEKIY
jgi:O-antigen/teichoic acid export membrane protein